jgi:hypothetical protein
MTDDNNYTRPPRRRKWHARIWKTEAEYVYRDAVGQKVFTVVRRLGWASETRQVFDDDTGKQVKRYFQHWEGTADGKKPANAPVLPYRLPELLAAVAAGQTVLVLEGERKVEQARTWGYVATCCADGAGKWRREHAEFLRGADVVIVPDHDDPGQRHADQVGRSLEGIATRRRLLLLPDLPEHGDIVDWIKAGGTRERFAELLAAAPEWTPFGPEPTTTTEADHWLALLNEQYCVVQDGGNTRVLRFDLNEQSKDGRVVHRRLTAQYFGFGDFHNYYRNQKLWTDDNGKIKKMEVGKWWTGHPRRRSYEGLTFRPDLPDQVVNSRLNLWRGWGVEPAAGDWALMRRHINEVLANNNLEAATYIVNWMAWAVQHPAEPAEVALVLKGGRGVGKGTLGNALVHIFGQHATHISSVRHLTGHHNAHLRDACLLFADEAYWPGDKSGEGALKRLITEPTLLIEPKFVDAMTVPNMLHVVMASNDDWVVPAGESERRYAVFQVSEHKRQDQTWFKPLYEQLTDGGYAAMLHDLLRHDLGDWHPRKVPMTDALRGQQIASLRPLDAWIIELLEDGVLPNNTKACPERTPSHTQAEYGRPANGLFDLARKRVPALRYHQMVRHRLGHTC